MKGFSLKDFFSLVPILRYRDENCCCDLTFYEISIKFVVLGFALLIEQFYYESPTFIIELVFNFLEFVYYSKGLRQILKGEV